MARVIFDAFVLILRREHAHGRRQRKAIAKRFSLCARMSMFEESMKQIIEG